MTSKEKKTILLIDDDTSLLLTLSDFLKFEGYEVVTADSGEEGLKRLEKIPPDLIILDMSMPGMGGVGFLREISTAEGKPTYPVLVLTARANMAEFFANVDVDGFVSKPCDPNDLLMEVGRIIFLRSGETGGAEPEGKPEKKRILVGEDDGAVNSRLVDALTSAGYIVDSVSRGPEVLEKAIVERPHLILVKFVFAGMNGDAVASMLKEMPNTKDIPIVLYDDSGAEVPESKFTEAGTGIRKFIRQNTTAALLAAVEDVLKTA